MRKVVYVVFDSTHVLGVYKKLKDAEACQNLNKYYKELGGHVDTRIYISKQRVV